MALTEFNYQFIVSITAGTILFIAGIIYNYVYLDYTKKRDAKKNYMSIYSKSKHLKPENLNIAKYNSHYIKRHADQQLYKALGQNKHFLITGMPGIGKTRAVYELMKKKDNFTVIKLWEKTIKFEEIPDKLFNGQIIVFLDDLNNFIKLINPHELIKMLEKNSDEYYIFATCRTGEELNEVKKWFKTVIGKFEIIEMKEFNENRGRELAGMLNLKFNEKEFDGTPGSIILEPDAMKQRYYELPIECKLVFGTLKLLYKAGTISPYTSIIRQIYLRILQEEKINPSKDFKSFIGQLLENSFILRSKNKEEIINVWHETYFTFDKDTLRDCEWLQSILKDINDIYGLLNLGNSFSLKGDYSEAMTCYENIIEIDPNHAKAWTSKGSAFKNLKRYDDALESYNKALEIDPKDVLAWTTKGDTLINLNKFDEALESFDEALKIDPTYLEAWANKGYVLYEQEKYEETVTSYDEALKMNPKYVEAWNNRGLAFTKMGRLDEALESFDKALEINPDYRIASENKELILMSGYYWEE